MINFDLELEGWARKLLETSEDTIFKDGVDKAIDQTRYEMQVNFVEGGRPNKWPWPKSGSNPPLWLTGRLMQACSADANIKYVGDGFELSAGGDRALIAAIHDPKYGIFVLPEEALDKIAQGLETGMLGG